MPVQNCNTKISVHPDLATNLLPILIPTTFKRLLFQSRQFALQLCPKRWFVKKIFGHYPKKVKIENIS